MALRQLHLSGEPNAEMPLRLGHQAEFACVRDFLRRAGFDEKAVTTALGIPTISRVRDVDMARIDRSTVAPDLLTAVDLFVGEHAVPAQRLRAACGEAAFAALIALDLIRVIDCGAAVFCPVWLYPVNDLLIISDRQTVPTGDGNLPVRDAVFPGHDAGTLRLLRLLPATMGSSLDLCGGSGIVALQLGRGGSHAVTTDITARSAHFADFNAKLNGLEIESLSGDLFEPVAGRTFDLISAHPPWLPSIGDGMIFRDGGETGESILQRTVAGVPRHLNPGGTAVVLSLGRDEHEASFQQRIRTWLGDAGRDCDVIVGIDKVLSIEEMVNSMRQLHHQLDSEKALHLANRFRALGTKQFLHGAIFIHRTEAVVTEPPLRLSMSADATAGDFGRIFSWRGFRRSIGFAGWLASAAPRPSPRLEVTVRHAVRDGAFVIASAAFAARGSLSIAVRPDIWAARVLMEFDGTRTVSGVFDVAQRSGQLPTDFTMAPFVDFVGQMIEWGILEIDGARLQGGVPGIGH